MGLLRLEHDDQLSSGTCTHCGAPFESVIGVMYEDDEPIAIYRADIFEHFHREPDPRVVLSIAVGDWSDGTNRADRCSATLEAWAEEDRVHMAFSDRAGSTWQELEVVSWQLTRAEAQAGPLREAFLRWGTTSCLRTGGCAGRSAGGRGPKACKPGLYIA